MDHAFHDLQSLMLSLCREIPMSKWRTLVAPTISKTKEERYVCIIMFVSFFTVTFQHVHHRKVEWNVEDICMPIMLGSRHLDAHRSCIFQLQMIARKEKLNKGVLRNIVVNKQVSQFVVCKTFWFKVLDYLEEQFQCLLATTIPLILKNDF